MAEAESWAHEDADPKVGQFNDTSRLLFHCSGMLGLGWSTGRLWL